MASHLIAIGLALAATLAFLQVTKIPWVVMLLAATTASVAFMVYARLAAGYWDKFAAIAFVVLWFYSALVSLTFVGIGRWRKWPLFVKKPTGGQGAL